MDRVYFTKEGIESYLAEIRQMEKRLKGMGGRLAELAEVGGDQYHDNFSYEQQMREIDMLSNELRSRKEVLGYAVVVDVAYRPKDTIAMGATVLVERDGVEKEWKIVGFGESDPDNSKIAYNTPIAQTIIGKKEGETVIFRNSTILIKKIY